jgi:hypothetical protein
VRRRAGAQGPDVSLLSIRLPARASERKDGPSADECMTDARVGCLLEVPVLAFPIADCPLLRGGWARGRLQGLAAMQRGIGFTAAALLVLSSSDPGFAAARDTRDRARRRQAAEQARPKPGPAASEPELGKLHLSLGFGGGNWGGAARAGGDLEVWVLPTLGVGVLVAAVAQAQIFGKSISYWMAGPAVTVRERAGGNLFATLGVGYSAPHWERPGLFTSGQQGDTQSVALQLEVGGLSSGQTFQLGGGLCIDAVFPPAQVGLGQTVAAAITLNFTLAASLR